jgi:hypothetical protein
MVLLEMKENLIESTRIEEFDFQKMLRDDWQAYHHFRRQLH